MIPSRQNRSPHAIVALLIQIAVSLSYSYSVFRIPLASLHGWSKAQTIAPYQYMSLTVSIGCVVGGIWQDRKGPRVVASCGAAMIALGCFLAAVFGGNFAMLVVTIGVIVGFGIGVVYVTPIANLIRWFPDKRGMMVGFAVAGTGCSTLFWAPLLEKLIGTIPARYAKTIPDTFLAMGVIFLVLIVGLAQFYRVPPEGWKPANLSPAKQRNASRSLTTGEMLRRWQFYALYVLFVLGAAVGLTTLGNAAPILQEETRTIAPFSVGLSLGLVGLCNAAGRLAWGSLSDHLGRRSVLAVMGLVSAAACLGLLREPGSFASVFAGLCVAVFAYGGILALMPAFAGDYFGPANVGANYGILFTAWGVSGFAAPGYFERLLDQARDSGTLAAGYSKVYTILAVISILAVGLVALLRPVPESSSQQV